MTRGSRGYDAAVGSEREDPGTPSFTTETPLDCGFRIVLIKNVFISPKSEIRNRQSAIKGHSVVN
ncbi:MAG: hypothetical protein DMG08_21065 [Acidobacteria bacterium]|nr:MAG: hypothetical protein DMG08_21065 [Acidobacteriota bacterium]PYV00970.1 MAG: hypothetical protein DMG10_19160 [Acidobacteriota bacterium]PYV39096.1 MAG: hypothetical protein DMG09_10060 [Acidobacteriota bacterium]